MDCQDIASRNGLARLTIREYGSPDVSTKAALAIARAAHTAPTTPPTGQARRNRVAAHTAAILLAAALAACGDASSAGDAAAESKLERSANHTACRDHLAEQLALADELARAVADPATTRRAAKQRAGRFTASTSAASDPDVGLACAAAIAYLEQAAERYQDGIAAWKNCGRDCGATLLAWSDARDLVAHADAAIAP